jgi:hypothetical protein
MKHTYTTLDFLRYYYNEMSPVEARSFETALVSDAMLEKEYTMMKEDILLLDRAEVAPSATLIHDLLDRLDIHENKKAAY